MESVYIENYVKIPVEQKIDFLKSISNSDAFQICNQELIFSEEAVILDFNSESDINLACHAIKDYFKEYEDIKVDKITKIHNKATQLIVEFNKTKSRIRI